MIVVSDTSPILNLSIVGRLDLIQNLFVEIAVPSAVAEELSRHRIDLPPWMRVVSAVDRKLLFEIQRRLDPGEAEAIIVAQELKASLTLIDENRGRRIAAEHGLEIMGLLGLLSEAKQRHFIPACKPLLDDMIQQAGFWIGHELRSRFLLASGERP